MTACFVLVMLLAVYQGCASVCAIVEHEDKTYPPVVSHAVVAPIFVSTLLLIVSIAGIICIWKP